MNKKEYNFWDDHSYEKTSKLNIQHITKGKGYEDYEGEYENMDDGHNVNSSKLNIQNIRKGNGCEEYEDDYECDLHEFIFEKHLTFLDVALEKRGVKSAYVFGCEDDSIIESEDDDFAVDDSVKPVMKTPKRKKFRQWIRSATRVKIENVFGILCSKFQVFARNLRLDPKNSRALIIACCVIHNISIGQLQAPPANFRDDPVVTDPYPTAEAQRTALKSFMLSR
ncbi:hypothetical protein CRE_11331 [Caenorhabditis remanei]|uniref:DDE Tnp4 domain-containing protein n=1 Tax=Caenorhabditis remanei TaxID=31234 RepID=E3N0D3_CAERE|nr:hypothetical protein CRE_11331 [Caenorhabditis remanei]